MNGYLFYIRSKFHLLMIIRISCPLRPLVKSHVQQILLTGTDVVLDFPANTLKQRAWFKISLQRSMQSIN